jgi:hypothetical protein
LSHRGVVVAKVVVAKVVAEVKGQAVEEISTGLLPRTVKEVQEEEPVQEAEVVATP